MASTPIIKDLSIIKRWAPGDLDSERDDVLERLVESATEMIEAETGRRIVQASYTEYFDGRAAHGANRDTLYVANPPIGGTPTVKENGVALVVGSGYDAAGSREVYLYASEGRLVRSRVTRSAPVWERAHGWASGRQNIEVAYSGGYAAAPAHLIQACAELTLLLFQESRRVGLASAVNPSGSGEFMKQLSPVAQAALQSERLYGRPM